MSDDEGLANEYRQATVEELQNVSSRIGNVDGTLDNVASTLNTMDSTLDKVESGIRDVESKLEELDSTLGDINAKLHDANNNLEGIQSTLTDIRTALTENRNHSDWVWIVVVIFLIGSWSGSKPDRFTDRVWYSMFYSADWQNVDIQRRPTDCDFLRAPIGSKRCSYNKEKLVFGASERQRLQAQAETQQEKDEISRRPNAVAVYWAKKDEP